MTAPRWIVQRITQKFVLLLITGWLVAACSSGAWSPYPLDTPAPESTGEQNNALAAIAQPSARHPIQNDIFYFVMPDRFANGTTANDLGNLEGDRFTTGYDPTNKGFYHGGDIAGLIDKLDYLDQLGITAIWITPLFKNKAVQGAGPDASAAYHGYWIVDFTTLDPHFGTTDELETLIEEAHSRDIKIFLDIIINHTADVIQYEENESNYRSKSEYPYRDANGLAFNDLDYAETGGFPTLSPTQSFPYTPVIPRADRNIKRPAWLNSPIYYHNRGNSQFNGENSLYGDFFGLDDLFTEHPKVVQGMIDIYKEWITNYAIDGFRIDTVKHVNIHFWRAFSDAILEHAESVGRDEFYIFGEVYSGNEQLLSYYTTDSDLPGVLDFRLQGSAREFVPRGGSAAMLTGLFEYDDFFIDEDSNAYSLPSFIGNHDMGRFGYFLREDHDGNLSDEEMLARAKLAHALMFLSRGVPVLYYGDEQGFTGDGGDQDARQNMFPSRVASYNDDDLIGTDATPADDNFDTEHPLYQAIYRYASLRQAHGALHTGAQIHRYAANGPGIYAFSRISRDEQTEYVVAFNNAAAAGASVPTFYGEGTDFVLQFVEGGSAPELLTTGADGHLEISVPPMGFVVYLAAQPIPPSPAAPEVTMATLTNQQEITLDFQELDGNQVPQRVEIRAEIDSAQYVEITFAVAESGSETFTPIGTDDNPPYRVFYDGSAWPDGTKLDFIAVVNDLNGHYSSALAENVTLLYQRPAAPDPRAASMRYAVVHYQRIDNGDYNGAYDEWGLHVWGDGLATDEATSWDAPKEFLGEDSYGRFAWIKLRDPAEEVGIVVHQGDTKDGTEEDRFFTPLTDGPEIWLKQGDPTLYTSQAAAQGYVTIHYQRDDGNYDGWGMHLWGEGIAAEVATEWESARPPDGTDEFGLYWQVPIVDVDQPLNFNVHRGEEKDPGPDQSLLPAKNAEVWIVSGDETVYPQRCAATNTALLHYHRPVGDYGDYASDDFGNFWGLHAWNAAEDPGWQNPYKPVATDSFGVIFQLDVDRSRDLGYIFHRGDSKDPGPDQFLNFERWGCEVWQTEGADPETPYVLPAPQIEPE